MIARTGTRWRRDRPYTVSPRPATTAAALVNAALDALFVWLGADRAEDGRLASSGPTRANGHCTDPHAPRAKAATTSHAADGGKCLIAGLSPIPPFRFNANGKENKI